MNQQKINPRLLHFDFANPRIAEFGIGENDTDLDIAKVLWDSMDVQEIVLSIKSSGFFQHEPLIVVKESNDKYVVIEGNRRLAAIKYLTESDFTNALGAVNRNDLNISEDVRNSLLEIPIILVEKREDAWKYIGFKHINGAAKWGSYAKAQYISLIKNEYNIPLAQIAEQIGDTNKTVKKLYQGLKVIEQAEHSKVFDRTDISANRLYFSHLYTALNYQGYKDYIGLDDNTEELENPVPPTKIEALGELLIWLFGSKKAEVEPRITSQNPDLRHLEAVLKSKEATYALKDGVPLVTAYELSQPKQKSFENSLYEAKRFLQKAQYQSTEGYDGTDIEILKVVGTIAKIADELYESMEAKFERIKNSQTKKERLTE